MCLVGRAKPKERSSTWQVVGVRYEYFVEWSQQAAGEVAGPSLRLTAASGDARGSLPSVEVRRRAKSGQFLAATEKLRQSLGSVHK